MYQYHGIAFLVSIQIKLSNNSKEDTFRSRMANELAFTRPFLKNINLQSRHLPRLPFRTWFSMKENWHLPRRQLNYIPTQPLQPGSLNWFGSMLQTLFVFPATIPNMFYHRFQVHALFLVDPSHSCELLTHPIDQPKRKLFSGLHIHPGCCFFCIKTHHVAVSLPKLVSQECHFKSTPLCQS